MKGDVDQFQPTRFVAGVLFVLIGIAFLLESFSVWKVQLVDLWPLLLVAFGTAVLLGRVRRVKVDEDRSAQLAVAEERVRIARELHDIVAHGVSLMTIQIAAARRVHKTQPDAAEQSLLAAEETGRQSLAELQGMLSMLRGADASIGAAGRRSVADSVGSAPWATQNGRRGGPYRQPPGRNGGRYWQAGVGWAGPRPAPGGPHGRGPGPAGSAPQDGVRREPPPRLADLDNLVTGLRQAGQNIETTVVGEPPALSPGVELVIYRVVQEGLTNAMRHAPQAQVQLELTYAPDHVLVFVDDDGAGTSAGKSASGHGLMGMQERVAAVGGTVQAGPRQPGPGWRVHARIPVSPVVV